MSESCRELLSEHLRPGLREREAPTIDTTCPIDTRCLWLYVAAELFAFY